MGYVKKLDRRIRKTREAIYEAFRNLSRSKSVGRITMTEIAEEADIDRKTLYNHYKTVEQIRLEQESGMVKKIGEALDTEDLDEVVRDPARLSEALSPGLTEYAPYVKGLLVHDSSPQILDSISRMLMNRLAPALRRLAPFGPEELSALSWHYATWIVSTYRAWLGTDLSMTYTGFYASLDGHLRSNYEILRLKYGGDGPILLKFDLKE